jgi:SPP1 gp7 family putative phage head morphogenesis protein
MKTKPTLRPTLIDPTRTTLMRKNFCMKIRVMFARLAKELDELIVKEDVFGLIQSTGKDPFTNNTRWKFNTNQQKIKAFQAWLKTAFAKHLKNRTIDQLWEAYILDGWRKGAGRAFDDTKAGEKSAPASSPAESLKQLGFYQGTRAEFLNSSFNAPEAVDKVKLLAGRTFDDLEGVTAAMSVKMSRLLTDGLVQGKGPREIANWLHKEIGIGSYRAQTIARTELIRAHAEGQLMAFQKLGVEQVGAAVEWSTAGDNRVCPLCRPLQGIVLRTEEATGMIPRHPNCRCSWIPANVGESVPSKLNTTKRINKAIGKSTKLGGDDFGPAKPISKQRPKGIFG